MDRNKDALVHDLPDAAYPSGYPMIYDTQFTVRRRITRAQSKWYDTAQAQPNYGNPIILPPAQPGGASYELEWQGADGMPNPVIPSRIIPDPTTETPWSANLDIADNKRFVRFKVKLIANLNSETVPRFEKISIPFSFRPN